MLTGDCSGCHTTANWNSDSIPAGHMPNPASSACTVCHTAAPTDYSTATLAAISVIHTGISSGCIACHGAPNATPPVFTPSYTPKDAVLSPVHIPTSSTPCESCHTPAAITAGGFSGTTMSSAKHTSMFAVIGKSCDACHDASTLKFYGVTNLQTRPNGHHTGQDCSGCHGTTNWGDGAAKKATAPAATRTTVGLVVRPGAGRRGTAAELADAPGGLAAARAAAGLAPVSAASGLSGATTPLVAGMSHTGVTNNCASCHDGALAAGKGPTHIASNNLCENCHTTVAWLPARFEHRGVTASCVTCHNSVEASGKPTRHIQTNQDCSACHGTISWKSALFSHVGIGATCQSCHNGITATGKQLGHVSTTLDCGSCHGTLTWAVTAAPSRLPPLLQRPRTTPGASPPSSPRAANGGPVP
jgi:predicted CXXCH cytochrome family protein